MKTTNHCFSRFLDEKTLRNMSANRLLNIFRAKFVDENGDRLVGDSIDAYRELIKSILDTKEHVKKKHERSVPTNYDKKYKNRKGVENAKSVSV